MRLIENGPDGVRAAHPHPRPAANDDITSVREKAHALMAGQTSLMRAPIFELRAADARAYRLTTTDAARAVTVRRNGSEALCACREIILPANRPVVMLVEGAADLRPEDRDALAALARPSRGTPALHPGSLIVCGMDSVHWV